MKGSRLWRLARPVTLTASLAPVLVGVAAGALRARVNLGLALDMLVVALLLQIGANMANEYFDHRRGVDHAQSVGIAGVIVSGEMSGDAVFRYTALTFLLAFLLGCVLGYFRGFAIIMLGLTSILLAVLYSAGPRPISATAFGEVAVFLLMGPLEVVVSEVAAIGYATRAGLLGSIAVGLLVAAILTANNLRDRESDAARGRRTLAILLGERRGRAFLLWTCVCGVLTPTLWVVLGLLPWTALLTLGALPLAFSVRRVGPLPRLLPAVSRLHLVNGLLLALGLAFGPLVR